LGTFIYVKFKEKAIIVMIRFYAESVSARFENCYKCFVFAIRYFEKEQFHDLADSVAFIGPHVAQCIKFLSGNYVCSV
jgi:hypothetical protein